LLGDSPLLRAAPINLGKARQRVELEVQAESCLTNGLISGPLGPHRTCIQTADLYPIQAVFSCYVSKGVNTRVVTRRPATMGTTPLNAKSLVSMQKTFKYSG
jgi:hypothetical protein